MVRESLEVGDEEGRDGKLLLLPGEPQLVAAIPRQRVEVGEEGGLLHVLPQEGVQGGESQFVPRVDVTGRAHFKTVESASVVCDICDEWCVFISLFTMSLINVRGQRDSELIDVEFLFYFVHYHYVRLQSCHTQFRGDSAPSRCFPARQITVHLEAAFVHIVHNEIDQIVVPPCVSVRLISAVF